MLFLVTIFSSYALADELDIVKTETFASYTIHEENSLKDDFNLGFFIAGYILLGGFLIFSMVRVWVDEYQRHKEFSGKLNEAMNEMNTLGLNI